MSESAKRDFTFTVRGDALGEIRGTQVPAGTMAAPGVEDVPPEARVVTQRALEMTDGLFQFAERSNAPDPNPPQAESAGS